MPAYQIQVRGLLDGATLFSPPDPLPAPANGGVIKIDAGVGVNVGRFDLDELVASDNFPIWLRAYQVEAAEPATRAIRTTLDTNGSLFDERVTPDIAAQGDAILMRPFVLATNIIIPIGGFLEILTDDTSDAFGGAPVAGPHFVYLDLVPIINDEQLTMIQQLSAFADMDSRSDGEVYTSFQAAAASGNDLIGSVSTPNGVNIAGALAASSQLAEAQVTIGDAAAAGESMVINLRRELGGASRILGTITIDSTFAANSVTTIPINNQNNNIEEGSVIRVERTYVAGMAPAPLTNTTVRMQVVPQQLSQ